MAAPRNQLPQVMTTALRGPRWCSISGSGPALGGGLEPGQVPGVEADRSPGSMGLRIATARQSSPGGEGVVGAGEAVADPLVVDLDAGRVEGEGDRVGDADGAQDAGEVGGRHGDGEVACGWGGFDVGAGDADREPVGRYGV